MNILAKIVEAKKREIEQLYALHDGTIPTVSHPAPSQMTPLFYQRLAEARVAGQPFFITEFKRESPSEGWINEHADLPAQVLAYARAGASAISVLTDEPFFGGRYADLKWAADTLAALPSKPLLLQKDFILDPLQIHWAKQHGADLILLIAAILEPAQLDFLKKTAESLGMGVLVEVHDEAELSKIEHLDFPVLGVNNRDLKTFRTALNRVNVLRRRTSGDIRSRFIIAESSIRDDRDFQAVRQADGFLIGTGLMQGGETGLKTSLAAHFQAQGRMLFKACGVRSQEVLGALSAGETPWQPDFIGINFSPVSKRHWDPMATDSTFKPPDRAVAVFYQNSEAEVRAVLEKCPFKTVQLYADEVSPAFVRSLKQRVILAARVSETTDFSALEPYASDVDFFILDGAVPGSGQRMGAAIPADFPYPFLLAGGLHEGNLTDVLAHERCIGVDIASGIETAGAVDITKVRRIAAQLSCVRCGSDGVRG